MAVKFHRCSAMWLKMDIHPCWRAQKALDKAGVEYDLALHSAVRFRRPEVAEMTGGRVPHHRVRGRLASIRIEGDRRARSGRHARPCPAGVSPAGAPAGTRRNGLGDHRDLCLDHGLDPREDLLEARPRDRQPVVLEPHDRAPRVRSGDAPAPPPPSASSAVPHGKLNSVAATPGDPCVHVHDRAHLRDARGRSSSDSIASTDAAPRLHAGRHRQHHPRAPRGT